MPVYNPSRAPAPPGKEDMYMEPNTEPIYVTITAWKEKRLHRTQGPDANLGYEYLTSWYIGQIPDDAVGSFVWDISFLNSSGVDTR